MTDPIVQPATAATPVIVTPKPFYVSKTMIFNTVALAVALLQYYQGALPAVNPHQFGMAVTVVNLVLRVVTKQPVTGGLIKDILTTSSK